MLVVRAGGDLRGGFTFCWPLLGVFENAPEHVRVRALKLIDSAWCVILFWVSQFRLEIRRELRGGLPCRPRWQH